MITINGVLCETIEQLEEQIASLPEDQKQFIRNDFNGVVNSPVQGVPQAVTPRQIRIALVMAGIPISTIETAIDSLPEPQKSVTRITWEYSVEFQRNNPLLVAMAPMLNMTTQQVDDLFALASTL